MLSLLPAALSLLLVPGLPGPGSAQPVPRTSEQEIPANDGWVTDLAGLLSTSEQSALEELMESYRSGSGHEIALLTIPSLESDALESFTLRVAETWGMGGEEDLGALFLVSRDDRKMRIEVGYGLEGNLPDVICGRILEHVVAPEFRKGRWFGGIRAGIEAIHAAAGGDYGPIERTSRGQRRSAGGFAVLPMMIFVLLFFVLSRRRRGMDGGSVLPWLLLSGMSHGRGGGGFGGGGGGGFGGFSGGGGFGGGGASGGW